MQVFGFDDPKIALSSLETDSYDLVILDLSLPVMDGLDVCKIIHEKYNTPIIISTARSNISDKMTGFSNGADDYLPKPYDLRELVVRIQSVLRRNNQNNISVKSEFMIDSSKMTISQNSKVLDLTLAEFEILKLLLNKRQIAISREYISDNIEVLNWDSSDKSIDVIISRIRHKIGDSVKTPKYIKSIRGIGYKFIGE